MAMLLYDYQNQLLNALNGLDRPDLSFRVNAGFIIVNLGLNVILVLVIGFEGAAVATVLAAGFGTVLAFVYLRRILSFVIPVMEILRQTGAALIMSVTVLVGRSMVRQSPIAGNNAAVVTVLVTIGAGTYFIVLLAISRQFRTAIAENAPARLPFVTDIR
jgi:O-antigen/teichoic acid export membrane protein